jgi:hypothetical protein
MTSPSEATAATAAMANMTTATVTEEEIEAVFEEEPEDTSKAAAPSTRHLTEYEELNAVSDDAWGDASKESFEKAQIHWNKFMRR